MNITEIVREEEKEFSKFEVEEDYTPGNGYFLLTFYDRSNIFMPKKVGSIYGAEYEGILSVNMITLTANYQGRGYSKFLYKRALELAKKKGFDGIMVGTGLIHPDKSKATYKNFKSRECILEEPWNTILTNKPIILTEWAPEKKEED